MLFKDTEFVEILKKARFSNNNVARDLYLWLLNTDGSMDDNKQRRIFKIANKYDKL